MAVREAYYHLHHYCQRYPRLKEDMESELILAAYLAWRNYDPSRGQWRSWLLRHLINATSEVLRNGDCARRESEKAYRATHSRVAWSADTAHESDESMTCEATDGLAEAFDRMARTELLASIGKILSPREFQVVSRHLFQDETFKAIAPALGVTPSQVRNIEMRACAKIRGAGLVQL